MCGGNDRATRAAERAEEERQQQVRDATAAIDRAFAGRQTQLDDFVNALRAQFTTEAERQKTIADRQLRFSLARGGLTGGSTAADLGENLGEEFQRGLLQGEALAQQSLGDLVLQDEAARSNLIGLAQGGADATTAATQATNTLRSNLTAARGRAGVESLGDIFANTRNVFVQQQEAAARRRGLRESEVFANPFSRS